MNVAIFSGELSGDLIGGALAREIRRLAPDVALWGLGSASMREAGVELLADSAAWSAIGIVESLGKVPGLLLNVSPKVRAALRERRPDVVVPIDFGAFNVRAAAYGKSLGLKVCYYFPPGAWRRNGTPNPELVRIADVLATPFPWSAQQLQAMGAKAVFVGHPLLERVRAGMSRAEFAGNFGMDPAKPIIGLLPGSRRQEVAHLMPALLDASRLIYRQAPDAQFVVGVAPSLSPELMARYLTGHAELRDRLSEIWHEFAQEAETKVWKRVTRTAGVLAAPRRPTLVTVGGVLVPPESLDQEMEARRRSEQLRLRAERNPPPTVLAKGLTYDVMAHSDVLLACSGTATLEAALFGTPMLVLYRGSKLMEIEYVARGLHKKLKFIGLPNILADRKIVPELIQWDATPEAIAEQAIALLNDLEIRQRVRQDLNALRESLGTPGASERTARLVLELAGRTDLNTP
jgi:lipid-A-disaccharide synthase